MSMEAIVKITETEEQMRLRRAEAIAQARQIREDARRNGEALLDQVRKEFQIPVVTDIHCVEDAIMAAES